MAVVVKTNGIPFRGFRCTTHFRTYFSGWIGMFTRGTIWVLPHSHMFGRFPGRFSVAQRSVLPRSMQASTWRRRPSGEVRPPPHQHSEGGMPVSFESSPLTLISKVSSGFLEFLLHCHLNGEGAAYAPYVVSNLHISKQPT